MHLLKSICSVALLVFACTSGKAQAPRISDYPSFEEVVTRLTREFDIVTPVHGDHFFKISRRPQGWFVQEEDWDGKVVKEQLYWSHEKREYLKVELPDMIFPSRTESDKTRILNQFSFGLKHNLFYHYPHWADDAILLLEAMTAPDDTALYHLARAFSDKAGSFFSPGVKDGYELSKWANKEKTEVRQLAADSGKYFVRKSIAVYEKLLSLNPAFQTVVGPVKVKLSNEHMFPWLELQTLNRAEESSEFLQTAVYDGVTLSVGKSILNSCPPNAILFVNGDNDTYPLLWAQEKLNFRKDVSVVNLSLLNTVGYVRYFHELIQDFRRIDFGRDMKWYYDNFEDGSFNIEKIKFAIPPGRAPVPDEGMGAYVKVDELTFSMRGQNPGYYLNQDIAMIDIIKANLGIRPICISTTVPSSSFLGQSRTLWQRGLVYQLLAAEGTPNDFNYQVMENHHLEVVSQHFDLSFIGDGRVDEQSLFPRNPGYTGFVFSYIPAIRLAALKKDEQALTSLCSTMFKVLDLYPYDESFVMERMAGDVCDASGYSLQAYEWWEKCMSHIRSLTDRMQEVPADEREMLKARMRSTLEWMEIAGDGRYKQEATRLLLKM